MKGITLVVMCWAVANGGSHEQKTQSRRVYSSVAVNTSCSVFEVDRRYLSLSLSPKRVASATEVLDWSSTRMKELAKGIQPLWLRVGGTESNYVTFASSNDTGSEMASSYKAHPVQIAMTPTQWDSINTYAERVHWKVLFDLNVQLRNGTSWDVSNAVSLLNYTATRRYRVAWGLGNEPDRFGSAKLPNTTYITPEQLAKDFSLLNGVMESMPYRGLIVGPDVSKPMQNASHLQFLKRFMTTSEELGQVVDAITWHQYYINSRNATLSQFISPSVMDTLHTQILLLKGTVGSVDVPIWLGETGDSWGGGTPGLSDTFAGCFMFLDKLGIAAAMNISVVMKQALVGGYYGLLDTNLYPLPSYWVSLLHKQLVGTRVLTVENGLKYGRSVRVYAHCTNYRHTQKSVVPQYSRGDITLIVLNLNQYTAELILLGTLKNRKKDMYIMTPVGYNVTSRNNTYCGDTKCRGMLGYCSAKAQKLGIGMAVYRQDRTYNKAVMVNGMKMTIQRHNRLPTLSPISQGEEDNIVMPSLSCGFIVVKAQALACSNP